MEGLALFSKSKIASFSICFFDVAQNCHFDFDKNLLTKILTFLTLLF